MLCNRQRTIRRVIAPHAHDSLHQTVVLLLQGPLPLHPLHPAGMHVQCEQFLLSFVLLGECQRASLSLYLR